MAERLTTIQDKQDLELAFREAPDPEAPPPDVVGEEKVAWRNYCRYYRKRLQMIAEDFSRKGGAQHRSPRCFTSYCEALGRNRRSPPQEARAEAPPAERGFTKAVLPEPGTANTGGKPSGIVLAAPEDDDGEPASGERLSAFRPGAVEPVPVPQAKPQPQPPLFRPAAPEPVPLPEAKAEPPPKLFRPAAVDPVPPPVAKPEPEPEPKPAGGSFAKMQTQAILERLERDVDALVRAVKATEPPIATILRYEPALVPLEMRPILKEYAEQYANSRWRRPLRVVFEPDC